MEMPEGAEQGVLCYILGIVVVPAHHVAVFKQPGAKMNYEFLESSLVAVEQAAREYNLRCFSRLHSLSPPRHN